MAWKLLHSEGDWTGDKHTATYMVGSEADISDPPEEDEELDAGSIAYTADLSGMWQKDASGAWQKIG